MEDGEEEDKQNRDRQRQPYLKKKMEDRAPRLQRRPKLADGRTESADKLGFQVVGAVECQLSSGGFQNLSEVEFFLSFLFFPPRPLKFLEAHALVASRFIPRRGKAHTSARIRNGGVA